MVVILFGIKKDTVILTERIFDDNDDWTEEEIIEQLEWDLDVSRVIIIPAEEGGCTSTRRRNG